MKKITFLLFLLLVIGGGIWLGRITGGDVVVDAAREVRTDFPLPPPPPEEEDMPDFSGNSKQDSSVVVELPVEGAEVDGKLTISGRADTLFKKILITLQRGDGELLFDEEVAVTGGGGDIFGRFSTEVDLSRYEPGDFQIIIRGFSSDGDGISITRDITLIREDALMVKIYFVVGESKEDNKKESECRNLQSVERTISSRSNVYRSVLERLTDGPTKEEQTKGLTSSLPSGATLRSVAADAEGVVTADFTPSLERGVLASCRVTSIRAQIEETLSQFPEVRKVVITVNGEEDSVLQP